MKIRMISFIFFKKEIEEKIFWPQARNKERQTRVGWAKPRPKSTKWRRFGLESFSFFDLDMDRSWEELRRKVESTLYWMRFLPKIDTSAFSPKFPSPTWPALDAFSTPQLRLSTPRFTPTPPSLYIFKEKKKKHKYLLSKFQMIIHYKLCFLQILYWEIFLIDIFTSFIWSVSLN